LIDWKLGRDKTRQSCLSPIVFTPPMQTRQDSLVLSCPCRRVNKVYDFRLDDLQNVKQYFLRSRRHTSPACVYLLRLLWPWPWPHYLDTEIWPR